MHFNTHVDVVGHGVYSVEMTLLGFAHTEDVGIEFALMLLVDGMLAMFCAPYDVIC